MLEILTIVSLLVTTVAGVIGIIEFSLYRIEMKIQNKLKMTEINELREIKKLLVDIKYYSNLTN